MSKCSRPCLKCQIARLNRELAMYRAFRDVHGAAAVMRELQLLVR